MDRTRFQIEPIGLLANWYRELFPLTTEDFNPSQKEFSRAMWAPELEQERRRANSECAQLKAKLSRFERFARLVPGHSSYVGSDDYFFLHLEFSRFQIGELIGRMDMAKDFMWTCVESHLMELFRGRGIWPAPK